MEMENRRRVKEEESREGRAKYSHGIEILLGLDRGAGASTYEKTA